MSIKPPTSCPKSCHILCLFPDFTGQYADIRKTWEHRSSYSWWSTTSHPSLLTANISNNKQQELANIPNISTKTHHHHRFKRQCLAWNCWIIRFHQDGGPVQWRVQDLMDIQAELSCKVCRLQLRPGDGHSSGAFRSDQELGCLHQCHWQFWSLDVDG